MELEFSPQRLRHSTHMPPPGWGLPLGRMRRIVLSACGWCSVGLAVGGVFLPLLPTTPFVLLAVACFARSSPTSHRWVMQHRWFGPFLRAYQEGKGLPSSTKILVLGMVWASLGASMAWGISEPWAHLRWVLVAIGIGVSWTILRLPTLRTPPTSDSVPFRDHLDIN